MTIREALTKSKNTVSVRLIESIGPEASIAFAHQAGIRSELPVSPTLALGTGEVSVLEIANAYTTFEDQGRLADPIIIVKVTDGAGKVLEELQGLTGATACDKSPPIRSGSIAGRRLATTSTPLVYPANAGCAG